MNFPRRWRLWVKGILSSARASVLVNGSPTAEFQCLRGVRQGDPLSPYLFLVAMAGLDLMLDRAKNTGIFEGILIPDGGPSLSHLFYADDAIILGAWSNANIDNLTRIFRCFHLVSGLDINLKKCALFGINVPEEIVMEKAAVMGCVHGEFPFSYLGLKVGANMNRKINWQSVVDVFERRLSRWKAKNLTLGGRLVLIKSVLESLPSYFFSLYKAPKGIIDTLEKIRFNFLWGGSHDTKKIHWIKRDDVCLPKSEGGLGLSRLVDVNRSLLCKWIWRLKTEGGRLWNKVICGIHGVNGQDPFIPCKSHLTGVWKSIVAVNRDLSRRNLGMEEWLVCSNGGWNWVTPSHDSFSTKSVRNLIRSRGSAEDSFRLDWYGAEESGVSSVASATTPPIGFSGGDMVYPKSYVKFAIQGRNNMSPTSSTSVVASNSVIVDAPSSDTSLFDVSRVNVPYSVIVDAPSTDDARSVDMPLLLSTVTSANEDGKRLCTLCGKWGYHDARTFFDGEEVHEHEVNEQGVDEQEVHEAVVSVNTFMSPKGTKYFIPEVEPQFKPVLGSLFENLDDAVNLYRSYAELAGFDTRLSTVKKQDKRKKEAGKDLKITHRYVLCTRAGNPSCKKDDPLDVTSITNIPRSTNIKVTGCTARIRVKLLKTCNLYKLYEFREAHNHPLVSSDNMDFMRKRRLLSFHAKDFIHKLSLARVGPNVAYRVQSALQGGSHNVKGTKTEFKNFNRDLHSFILPKDAQMVKDMMEERSKNLENFYFECIESDGERKSLFWADNVSRCNYQVFGDVVAFDATYDTNMYGMIFVPFTGVDHHKKCVTFASALLYDETTESFTWMLECFLKAHGTQPKLVLTDQDPAMRQAILKVFNESEHRLCMWHIMYKLPHKIKGDILQNTNLRKRIHKLVWNKYITSSGFEEKWNLLMADCKLENHKWLRKVFAIRNEWVPAFFRDKPMSWLMRTTSRSENSNAYFKINSSSTNSLVQFMLCFDMAIDRQRHEQRVLEFATDTTTPVLTTRLELEKHAALVYTRNIFNQVQREVSLCVAYIMIGIPQLVDGVEHILVSQFKRSKKYFECKVIYNPTDCSLTCSCMAFNCIGLLCRHMYAVLRMKDITLIPEKYICPRWKKNALPKKVFSLEFQYRFDNSESFKLRKEALEIVQDCSDRIRSNPEKLAQLVEQLTVIKSKIFEEFPSEPSSKAGDVFKDLTSLKEPEHVSTGPPSGIKTKGSGTSKSRRLIGLREKGKLKAKRKKRICKKCGKLAYHDSRNCTYKGNKEDESDEDDEDDEDDESDESDEDYVGD
ncbi:hypothetical protein SSX86_001435 [Deinandra increscens subsp. villosa]|uniref:SWIM-type domain-containing protein n=1 Tax=Deinandra increscens subsp. villosa TaxID=3103831 RepID=A0AAP0DVB9_9ASTR